MVSDDKKTVVIAKHKHRKWIASALFFFIAINSSMGYSNTRKMTFKMSTSSNAVSSNPSLLQRSEFLSSVKTAIGIASLTTIPAANAFDGGVGGLGKTKPQTGVVFRDDASFSPDVGSDGMIFSEILAPDKTPVIASFRAPWPILKTSGIESRDLANPESAFVQVGKIPWTVSCACSLPTSFFIDTVFSQAGKYGMYGAPTDVKVKKLADSDDDLKLPTIYAATFTTLTPAMRESERKAFISVKFVGDGAFMLVTGTTTPRFKNQEKLLRTVAESFRCIEAPKSSLMKSQQSVASLES